MKSIKEDSFGTAPVHVNSMGMSSSTAATGGIDTVDPLLNNRTKKRKLKEILKKKKND